MSMNRPMKLSLTVSIIVFLVIGFILPSSVIAIHIDDIDGIWTDGFEDRNTTKRLTNGTSQCIWEDGTILLARTSTGGRNYTFADGGSFLDNDHKAYYYQSALPINLLSFLFSPSRHKGSEHEFDEDFQYPNIEDFNETTNRYAESSSIGYKKYVVQHFRFKLDGNAESIGDLDIYWYGKADNARKIAMYYWTSSKIFLSWEPLDETDATGDVVLFNTLSKADLKQALSSDNYIDICVVATATKASSGCTLFTDYVKLRSTQQEGFKIGYGLVQTNFTVDLGTKKYWD
ncbi:MAG: hypothetical protein MUO73_00310, partial [Thermoplasmata archaeon]|nr:hypothetical protein [Thermoplasmata archaeon]